MLYGLQLVKVYQSQDFHVKYGTSYLYHYIDFFIPVVLIANVQYSALNMEYCIGL